jgi:ankyrin repeat protein
MTKYLKSFFYLSIAIWFSVSTAGAYEDFFKAVELDDGRAVTQLLARGFDPNTPDAKGQFGLFLALRGESYKAAQALLPHPDLKVDAANPADETALMMAALRGSVDWCQRLLDRGAQVNREGWAPLHYAASGPEPKVLTLLLDRGAAIDAQAANGATALMMAASYGSEDSVVLLLARGANPKLTDKRNQTAAGFAHLSGRDALAQRLERAAR